MQALFKNRYTKEGVRSFRVNLGGSKFLYIVFEDVDKPSFVLKGVSTYDEQDRLLRKLVNNGTPVQLRGFASSVGTEEDYLVKSGLFDFEEVVV